ncbi:MAG: ABC transporter ATP-binding protein [Beijerinckiaceae bacterium]
MTAGVSLSLNQIAKTFPDGTKALKPTWLSVNKGETVVLLGPSGCGKTTLLRIIAGLEKPDAGGAVLFDGEDVTATEIEHRNIGMVFQSYALFPNMTVAENIAYGLKIRKVAAADKAKRVSEMLALCGIEALKDRRIDQLSGGQRQRVALARAVAIRPRVLLLDEPLTALDAALRERLRSELDQLLRSLGITTIYVTHDQAEAMGLGDRIVVMKQGEIVQIGTPREVYFEPNSRFVAEFIGAANVIEGQVSGGVLQLQGGKLVLPEGIPSGAQTVMLRPESVFVSGPENAAWTGTVHSVSFLGDRQRLTITGAARLPVMAEAPNTSVVKPGDQVGLSVKPEAIRMLTA